jgi:hypothetical protein
LETATSVASTTSLPATADVTTPPTRTAVANGRYVNPVELDNRTLTVQPPTANERPSISEQDAATEIWAGSVFAGYHQVEMGFGIGTLAGEPTVTVLPAWIGFGTASTFSCPAMIAPTGPTTTEQAPPTPGYAAVILGAASGAPAITYGSRGAICGSPPTGPTVSPASEVVSVPWVETGPESGGEIADQASVPTCGTLAGESGGGNSTSMTWTVNAVVPDAELGCAGTRTVEVTMRVTLPNLPGVPATVVTSIGHGPLGPVQQARPGGPVDNFGLCGVDTAGCPPWLLRAAGGCSCVTGWLDDDRIGT